MKRDIVEQLGLTKEEYKRITKLLKREPNYTELGMFSAMWSEHCSYKNSKRVLKFFPTKGKQVLQGPGENSGVLKVDDKTGIAIKIESHNHPSAIEPYQAAATGGGGCLRDIFTMGARPIALVGSLRLGTLRTSRTKYLLKNIARGFVDYANKVDIPVIGGEIYFDESYEGNPLVNAFALGVVKQKNLTKARASGVGSLVIIAGRATGRDGVEGAALASVGLDEEAGNKTSAVAIGDPKMGRVLREACLDLIESELVVGMQDMGAAGLTCSTSETAYKAGTGMEVNVSLAPCSEKDMTAYEIMLSESQERMLVIIKPKNLKKVERIFNKWGVPMQVIGKVIKEKILRIKEDEKIVAELSPKVLVEAPVYNRRYKKPPYLKEINALDITKIKQPKDYNRVLFRLLESPTIRSKYSLYSKSKKSLNDILLGPGSDAAIFKVPGTKKKVAVTVDGNSTYCLLSPYNGGKTCVAEAARNLVASGARPLGLTDGLNFGNPKDPGIYWYFRQAVLGISKACSEFNIPVVSGNVSFNNENPKGAVDPSPIIGMIGVIEDGSRVITQWFKKAGDAILLLGKTKQEIGGSQYLQVIHGLKKGIPPMLDMGLEKRLQRTVLELAKKGLINSAHDCSEGGLAVALAESCISSGKKLMGATVNLNSKMREDALLFGESQSRIVISCDKKSVGKIKSAAFKNNVPLQILGRVGGSRFKVLNAQRELIDAGLKKLLKIWRKRLVN